MILGKGWGGAKYGRGAYKFSKLLFGLRSTHPARDVGDVGAAVKLDVGAVLPYLRPQLDAVTGFGMTFPIGIFMRHGISYETNNLVSDLRT